eukprot:1955916-Pyramimonas_sp.AAC.1
MHSLAPNRELGGISKKRKVPCRYPSPVSPFSASWEGIVATAEIRLEILVRTHPVRGLGNSGIGTLRLPQDRAAPHG